MAIDDSLHRAMDPSHVRSFLESELTTVLPDGVTLSYGETSTIRLPIDIALTDQSDTEGVRAALRADLNGGDSTGFDPAEVDDKLVVSFTTCVVHGVVD